MDQLQTPSDKSGGCGCGGGATVSSDRVVNLTEQQEKLIARIKKTNQKPNSVYKTKTRYFM